MIISLEQKREEERNFIDFFTVTMCLSKHELAALDHVLPMTQNLFNSIMDKLMEHGSDTEKTFYNLMYEYPHFLQEYADRIEKELDEKYPETNIPETTQEDMDRMWKNLCERIRKEFGENAI